MRTINENLLDLHWKDLGTCDNTTTTGESMNHFKWILEQLIVCVSATNKCEGKGYKYTKGTCKYMRNARNC